MFILVHLNIAPLPSPLLSSPLSSAPLLFPLLSDWFRHRRIVNVRRVFDEFPQEGAKQISRQAQLYSLMPDLPSECELSAQYVADNGPTSPLFSLCSNFFFLSSPPLQQDDITLSVVRPP